MQLHTRCGTTTTAPLAYDHCAERLEPAELTSVAGPGLEDHCLLDHVGEVG